MRLPSRRVGTGYPDELGFAMTLRLRTVIARSVTAKQSRLKNICNYCFSQSYENLPKFYFLS